MNIQKTRAEILSIAQNLNIQTGFIRVYSYVDDLDSRVDSYVSYSMTNVPTTVDGVQISFYDEFGREIERLGVADENVTVAEYETALANPVSNSIVETATTESATINLCDDISIDTHVELTAYLVATYDVTQLDTLLQAPSENRVIDNPITLCLAESQYFTAALQDAYYIKKNQFQTLDIDFSKKLNEFLRSKPLQKPITKNGVVCSIAAKLAKSGIKNPMQAAWKLYKAVLRMFHELRTGNVRLAIHIAKQIKTKIYALDATSIITDFFSPKTAEFIINLAR